MTEDEKRAHAARIILDGQENVNFSDVYEDDELDEVSDDDLEAIHDLILNAKVAVSWDD